MTTQNPFLINASAGSTLPLRSVEGFDDHEFLMALSDAESNLNAFVAVHNTKLGPALGGTRMMSYESEMAAVQDVLKLSRAMSYKCALANLPYGGGKAVIVVDPQMDHAAVLAAYARLIQKLGGLFKTGTDVGVTDDDVRHMAKYTDHMLGISPADRQDLSTSKTAAYGVFHAFKAVTHQLNSSNELAGATLAIKGAGKLGGELARLATEAGVQVTVSDVNPDVCERLLQQLPAIRVVANEDIHKQAVDVYAPCALGGEFNPMTIKELRCRAIAGGANNQLENDAAGDALHEKGILYAPDYVANAGGLIYVADELEPGGFDRSRVLARTEAIEQTLTDIFIQAQEQDLPTYRVADNLASVRIHGDRHAK